MSTTRDYQNHGGEGSGPGLIEPDDKMQHSDSAYQSHLNKTSAAVGAGPSLRTHAGRQEHRQKPHSDSSHSHDLDAAETHRTASTDGLTQTKSMRDSKLSKVRTYMGLTPEAPIVDGHDVHNHLAWSSVRVMFREPFAEFFGTFVMILFGCGSVAQVVLSTGQTTAPGGNGFGSYQSISWGWGLGVMLGIYVAGDSGGFLNPAVTFSFCLFRKLPWRRWPIYFLAQVLGAFCASGVVYANYITAIDAVNGPGMRTVPPAKGATAGIFCTYPQAFLTKASQFFSEFIASSILMFVIFALKDDSNPGAMGKSGAGQLFPLALFFLIFGLGACFGWETGYAINLARDFGPRLMSYCLGYGHEVWSAGSYYFWIPMVAPFCGCTFGAFLYDVFIYTGPDSPVNTPWMGLKGLVTGRHIRDRMATKEMV
jgi:aquaglyceroporin related protein